MHTARLLILLLLSIPAPAHAQAAASKVRRERHEPDGLWIGIGLGAAAGLTYVSLSCRSVYSDRQECLNAGRLLLVPPAIVAGALVDWRIRRFETIFQRGTSSAPRVTITPVLSRRHTSVTAGVAF